MKPIGNSKKKRKKSDLDTHKNETMIKYDRNGKHFETPQMKPRSLQWFQQSLNGTLIN